GGVQLPVLPLPYSLRYENGIGSVSPGCSSNAAKSIDCRCSRGGVPVFNRPSSKPSFARQPDRPVAAASPTRPPSVLRSPVCIKPRRDVPVVTMTARQVSWVPSAGATAGIEDGGWRIDDG